jgi:hypothetical protein
MSELVVGVLYSSREWRPAFQRHVRDHVVGVSLRLVRDSRMALEEELDVLLVDDETSFLGPPFVAALRERGTRIVGVYDRNELEGESSNFLRRLGVDRLVPSTLEPEDLLAEIEQLRPDVDLDDRFDQVVAGLELADRPQPSQIVAVGGPPAAGATEVAVALADVVSGQGRTVLVDVDEVAPGVARRLHLSLHPHVLSALDELHGAGVGVLENLPGHPLERTLARPAVGGNGPPRFDVIAGLANPRDWHLLRGDDVARLLVELAGSWDCVIANLGPHLEDLSRYVDRFSASRATVSQADRLVGVCEASPRGLLRFFDWLVEVDDLAPGRGVEVVVNRTPRSPFRQAELERQLHEHAGRQLGSVSFLPEDAAVGRSAWDGVVVPGCRFRRAVEALAVKVVPLAVARRRLRIRS